ncbi:MAG: hypothetical protein U1E26_00590 [Coriobacteriia bacterium]|nr:hypothetical protein [Coriobacteriia bacterium]
MRHVVHIAAAAAPLHSGLSDEPTYAAESTGTVSPHADGAPTAPVNDSELPAS